MCPRRPKTYAPLAAHVSRRLARPGLGGSRPGLVLLRIGLVELDARAGLLDALMMLSAGVRKAAVLLAVVWRGGFFSRYGT